MNKRKSNMLSRKRTMTRLNRDQAYLMQQPKDEYGISALTKVLLLEAGFPHYNYVMKHHIKRLKEGKQ